jgi:cytochrome c oxidase subunit II
VSRALRSFARSSKIRLIAVLGLSLMVLAGCAQATNANPVPGFFPPPAATTQGKATAGLYDVVFWITVTIFFIVEGLIVWSVIRYRRRRGDDELPAQTHGHLGLELTWTIVPIILVLFTWVLTMQTQNTVLAEPANPAVTVDVTGFQWQWTFDYKALGLSFTGVGSDGPTMVIPVNQTIHINEHSNDVIHSFYIRDFLFKRDVVPGRTNSFDFKVDQIGTYSGQCAEFCGLGHAQMLFTIKAVSMTDYQAWVKAEQAKAAETPTPAPGASGSAAATTVIKLTAKDIKFSTSTLTAPANQAFQIQFTNDDAVPHNVAIFQGTDATGKNVFRGTIFAGPGKTMTYDVPALPAGTYYFHCDVHPTQMFGTLTVK